MPVPAFGRAKRVTDPLDDKVKARLRGDMEHCLPAGCTSSEQGAADLSGSIRGYFFSDSEQGAPEHDDEFAKDKDDPSAGHCSSYAVSTAGMIRDIVNPRAASPAEDRFRQRLEADAAAVAASFPGLRPNPASFRRAVMGSLREMRYDAGICESRWESEGGGLVAGTYEYIDVLTSPTTASPQRRYIVDVDFAGEFEIARATAEYARLVAELPPVFVGTPEVLRRLLTVLAQAAGRSLREREMHVPPWRRSRYLQAKWLGPYGRTVSTVPATPPPSAAASSPSRPPLRPGRGDVKCRLVGFGGRLV